MFDFYERRKIRQSIYSWPSIIILVVLSALLANGVWGVYQKERQTNRNKNQGLARLEELTVRKDLLEEEIARLNTARGVEEEIRQKFEVARKDEKVIVIIDPPQSESSYDINESDNVFKVFLRKILFWRK